MMTEEIASIAENVKRLYEKCGDTGSLIFGVTLEDGKFTVCVQGHTQCNGIDHENCEEVGFIMTGLKFDNLMEAGKYASMLGNICTPYLKESFPTARNLASIANIGVSHRRKNKPEVSANDN